MQIDIEAHGTELSADARQRVEHRMRNVLARLAHRVTHVVVYLTDLNGPRGGVDKHCCVEVRMSHERAVVVEEKHRDLFHAVDRGLSRAAQAVTRRVKRGLAQRRASRAARDDDDTRQGWRRHGQLELG